MARIGADPDELRLLGTRLDALGRQLDGSATSIDTALRRTHWRGPDADRFRAHWGGEHRSSIRRAVATCGNLANELKHHADEQVGASDDLRGDITRADTTLTPTEMTTPRADVRPTTGEITHAGASNTPSAPPTETPTPSTLMTPIPDEITSLAVGAEGTLASGLAVGEHHITVENFGDERLVTITTRDGLGVRGSTGASVTIGSIETDTSTNGDAVLGVVTRRSFRTDEAGLATTIAGGEVVGIAQRAGRTARIMPLPSLSMLGPLANAVELISDKLGVLPRAVRTETLAEFAATGSIAATLPTGGGGSTSLRGVVRVGRSEGTTGSSTVLEAEGTIARTISRSIIEPGPDDLPSRSQIESSSATPDTTYSTRLEIFTEDGQNRAVLRTDTIRGSTVHRTISEFSPGQTGVPPTAGNLLGVADDIRSGNIDRALTRLTGMGLSDQPTGTAHTTFQLSSRDGALGASGGEVVTFGGRASGEYSRMVRVSG